MATQPQSAPGNNNGNGQRTFLGHPVGLYILFFTEMWERFSYYGMRAILILYMINYFKWSQEGASKIYKWYTALVYLTPLLGGYLADRYLGNKKAVIIGAILMAIGQFLLAFDPLASFFAGLVFMIIGNGFFKPNMSTQVGRLYPPNDPRRDGAYTIFYMGINLGAFLAPLVCGWLAEHSPWKHHAGFIAAGVGMVLGLVIYLGGERWVLELDQGGKPEPSPAGHPPLAADGGPLSAPGEEAGMEIPPPAPADGPISEQVADRTPSVAPAVNRLAPTLFVALGVIVAVLSPILGLVGLVAWDNVVALEIAAGCSAMFSWILTKIHNAMRDRVLTIFVLGIWVVLFWAAAEQAGNVLNVWADKSTDRYLTAESQPPPVFPEVKEEGAAEKEPQSGGILGWFSGLWNPVPTAWFQAVNPLAIFIFAPVFAFLWTWLARRGWNPSIPTKMAFGVLLVAIGFAFMIGASERENQPSEFSLASPLPRGIELNSENQLSSRTDGELKPFQAGRMVYHPESKTLHVRGVLADNERERMIGATAPKTFVKQLEKLAKETKNLEKGDRRQAVLKPVPPGFDLRYAGFKKKDVSFDRRTRTLTVAIPLAGKDVKALKVAAGEPKFRRVMDQVMVETSKYRVSPWWLFWSYILMTIGELCLSPVGLSMVSKLAPAKFATMLMGLWMLTSFFGNFVAGAFGEKWGTWAPIPYFTFFTVFLVAASAVLFLLVRKIVALMHGVN
jgi:POT family proton-dependent oligopeptide transporter